VPSSSVVDLMAGRPPVIPVLHVEDPDSAEPLLEALVSGGITVLEVTLRSRAALEVIRRMVRAGTDAVVGAGTLTRKEHFAQVAEAGARFAVSPALTPALAEGAHACGLPYLPGVATPSEALRAREEGFEALKFFPAELFGGVGWLNHVRPLYPELRFCPTAGVNDATLAAFLAAENVFAAGGAWLAPRDRIDARDWSGIASAAARAVAIAAAARR
jgi:2-dehydro-3-deoxyphosphogluconate aldolase / (4S)-4-hydroxy-2-oxoglutarate aldolase